MLAMNFEHTLFCLLCLSKKWVELSDFWWKVNSLFIIAFRFSGPETSPPHGRSVFTSGNWGGRYSKKLFRKHYGLSHDVKEKEALITIQLWFWSVGSSHYDHFDYSVTGMHVFLQVALALMSSLVVHLCRQLSHLHVHTLCYYFWDFKHL